MSVQILVRCPDCHSSEVIKGGQQSGTQRYGCTKTDCPRTIFKLQYKHRAYMPGIRQQIIAMTINGSGIRDIGRVLKINPNTVISVIKKKKTILVE